MQLLITEKELGIIKSYMKQKGYHDFFYEGIHFHLNDIANILETNIPKK